MKVIVSSPIESAQVASIVMSGAAYTSESNFQPAAKSNTALPTREYKVSVEATIGFIRANYDSLFRKLAE